MGKGVKLPECGTVTIVEGLMGAGKSFWCVGEVLRILEYERRPVYTNLPLRWLVFRQYLRLKGGAKLAGLVHPLSREHFAAFCERQHARMLLRERMKARKQQRGQRWSEARFDRVWVRVAGPDVLEGPRANWIEATACIFIDEVRHWYPMEDQKSEDARALAGYLAMLRHHLHRLVVVSQDRMQVAIAFRRLAQRYVQVRQRGEDTIAWGIRFKHLGIKAIGWGEWTAEQESSPGSMEGTRPIRQGTIVHWAPWERWRFRLYDSFTHVGGVRRLRRQLNAARVRAGLPAEGGYRERERLTRGERMRRWLRRGVRWGTWATLLVVGMVVGVSLVGPGAAPEAAADGGSRVQAVAEARVPGPWFSIQGASHAGVIVGGRFVPVGGRVETFELLAADETGSVWGDGVGHVWVRARGDDGPRHLGHVKYAVDTLRRLARVEADGGAEPSR